MSYQHQNLANGRWFTFSFYEQMANIGSEVIRALNWHKKNNESYSKMAYERALELLYLTCDDKKNIPRIRELLRLQEVLADCYYDNKNYKLDAKGLENYFLAFTYAARNNSGLI